MSESIRKTSDQLFSSKRGTSSKIGVGETD